MAEEFVTLETAKLLKEKGFNWKCERTISCDNIIRSDNACGYNETEEIRKECITLVEQIIESKKQIGEDFTRDECVLNKLKINEQ